MKKYNPIDKGGIVILGETERIFKILISGRRDERDAVYAGLIEKSLAIDYAQLRKLILGALQDEYSVDKVSKNTGKEEARRRLLSSLGRVAEGHKKAEEYLKAHTDKAKEPDDGSRYWAFRVLVEMESKELEPLAKRIIQRDDYREVVYLAKAFLASRGKGLLDDILDALAAAISAKLAHKNPISIPEIKQIDSRGIRMEIVYGKP